jgi:hypothetical protein
MGERMFRLLLVVIGLAALSACESGRMISCECSGADVLEGEHPADADYGSCAASDFTCWVLPNEPIDECSEEHEAEGQELICCEGEDCRCSCTDQGKATG